MKRVMWAAVTAGVMVAAVWLAQHAGVSPTLPPLNALPPLGGDLPLGELKLPPGFQISVFAEAKHARTLCWGKQGTLFVGTREGPVYAVRDPDGDGRAETITLLQGLDEPNGLAFHDGALYVAEVSRIFKLPGIESRLNDPPAPVEVAGLPSERRHGWRYMALGPDGWLYVAIGAPCNVCRREAPFSSIIRMRPDGSRREVYAQGIRNSVGFDWRPATGVFWFSNNGRDWMGDDNPPDSLHRAPEPGLDFGFPDCHAGVPDPELNPGGDCAGYAPAALKLPAHVAPLGIHFYRGGIFPPEYEGRLFVAEHGSWNRSTPVGYRVSMVVLEGDKAVQYLPFATGWLSGQTAWGRPVDVTQTPDGALLISDDRAGVIYRVTYQKP